MFVSPNLLNYDIHNTVMNTSIKQPRMVNPGTGFRIFLDQTTTPGGLEVHTTDGYIEVDTTPCRESMGYGQLSDASLVKRKAEEGKEKCAEYTRSLAREGDAYIYDQASEAQIQENRFKENIAPKGTELVFYPAVPPELTAHPGTTDIEHHPTDVNIDWQNTDIIKYQLERGTVSFDIVQKAYIDFTYTGEPIYFPLSVDRA